MPCFTISAFSMTPGLVVLLDFFFDILQFVLCSIVKAYNMYNGNAFNIVMHTGLWREVWYAIPPPLLLPSKRGDFPMTANCFISSQLRIFFVVVFMGHHILVACVHIVGFDQMKCSSISSFIQAFYITCAKLLKSPLMAIYILPPPPKKKRQRRTHINGSPCFNSSLLSRVYSLPSISPSV